MKRQSIVSMCIGVVVCTMILCTPAMAKTLYVNRDITDSGDGQTWQTAYKTIQEALDAAAVGLGPCYGTMDAIWVKGGTYYLTSQLYISKAVKLLGGFDGTETEEGQRDPVSNRTLIDGRHLVRCMYIRTPCTVDGFTIRNGYAPASDDVGAGIYIDKALVYCTYFNKYVSPHIRGCTFIGHEAGDGGAVYIRASDAVFERCIFRSNTAKCGGAVYHAYSSPDFLQCIFTNNTSTSSSSLGGGAIAGLQTNAKTSRIPRIANSLFYDNSAGDYGGAIGYNSVESSINYCTFTRNEAKFAGGAIHVVPYTGSPTIQNSIFWDDYPDELVIHTGRTYPIVSYSDIDGGWLGSEPGNIDADPLFVSTTNFHLTEGSPCIDAGKTAYWTTDLAGATRPMDGDEDGTARADMGAYEFDPDALPYFPFDPVKPPVLKIISVTP